MLTMDLLLTGDSEAIRKEIIPVNLEPLADNVNDYQYKNFFRAGPGREHYKLLSAISSLFSGKKIFDIGTHYGLSALALSTNPEVTVISYDGENQLKLNSIPPNVEFKLGDFHGDPDLLSSPFILVGNFGLHDGVQEHLIHTFFQESKYEGLVLWDNIYCNNVMTEWWNNLPISTAFKKWDISNAGHWAGTGLIKYG